MKKSLLFISMMLFLSGSMMQAQAQSTYKERRAAKEASVKEQKAKQKLIDEANNQVSFEVAQQAMKNNSFVLVVDQLDFKRGHLEYVMSNTNFISVDKNKAVIQIAFTGGFSGPNGIGGITVDGSANYVELKTDKKGDVIYTMSVQGTAVSASVDIRMYKGSNEAYATVSPNFNSRRLSLRGKIYPIDQAQIFQGRSL